MDITKNKAVRKIKMISDAVNSQSGKTPFATDVVLDNAKYTEKSRIMKNPATALITAACMESFRLLLVLLI